MQLHKRRTTEQVIDILDKYLRKEIKAKEAAAYIGVGRTRFYQLTHEYNEKGSAFTIEYERKSPSRTINPTIEKNLRMELGYNGVRYFYFFFYFSTI